ncbi:family 20 glycosylhydrolase [Elizabethkingia meningoseptica]|uniref:family 20 glycosylhydrolase n=1 Tax=Elizabethkingia meningoseptica TaxID=238 RepID=UPI0023B0F8CD|nr:family 20 glycosylhydrolase [Elizabethkingia meningoseptica]MDE5438637.1 family 20 glycosylhydrolase [Elizabethkingia meningoseptica]MDE5507708.1 family 20 glycosylhydrolase [Elizabethkingia meningoseptica]MDE5516442.1 family 20 glycosylhydrolase [Elizabethkingia meningoseptica]MDE5526688.1 family 20 glycosylhydrolase [Elizabethkingia meningoseptica]MDE5530693.1 family 20 glycosylhydrolase [Elizabethkingia meningoseptica]
MRIFILLITGLFGLIPFKAQQKMPSLIPFPQKIEKSEGYFTWKNKTLTYNAEPGQKWSNAERMLSKSLSGGKIMKKGNAKEANLLLRVNPNLAPEAYSLVVTSKKIELSAATEAGALYGLQTLQQLYLLSKDTPNPGIPVLSIQDKPAYSWRGVELDVARHFFSKEYLYKFIDLLSGYKFNKLHLHLTDDQGWRIEIKKYPKLIEQGAWRKFNDQDLACIKKAQDNPDFELPKEHIRTVNGQQEYGGYYTQQDIKDIIAYASSRSIEIIPEIDMPGHMMVATTAYPELLLDGTSAGWGKQFSVPINVCKESSYSFIENVLNEVIDLFPSKYIHIGADEVEKTSWEHAALCQKFMQDNKLGSLHDLQSYFVQRVNQFIQSKGKTAIGWDEILEGPSASSMTVMYWRGWKKNAPLEAVNRNHSLIMSPTNPLYFDYLPNSSTLESVYKMSVIPSDIPENKRNLIQGAQANVWSEMIPSRERLEFMILPRLSALAERVWTDKDLYSSYQQRLIDHYKLWDIKDYRYRMPDLTGFTDEQVIIDGKSVLHVNNPLPGSKVHYTLDGSLPSAVSPVLQKSLVIQQTTKIRFATFSPSGAKSELYQVLTKPGKWNTGVQPKSTNAGLRATFFSGVFPNTKGIKGEPVKHEIIKNVHLSDTIKMPAFGTKIKGFIRVPSKEIYNFYFTCDDGGVLKIANQLVVDNDGQHAPVMKSGQIALEAGYHPIDIDFIEAGGGFTLKLYYSINGSEPQPIPDNWFYY